MLAFIDRYLKHIEPRVFQDRVDLNAWQFRLTEYHGPGRYRAVPAAKDVIRLGEYWGEPGTTAFLERTVTIPDAYHGRHAALLLRVGGEALLRIDGKAYHGLDRYHEVVTLAAPAEAGRTYRVQIEVFNPVPRPPDPLNDQKGSPFPDAGRLSAAQLVCIDSVLADVYFTLRAYRNAAGALPAGDPRRERMIKLLADAVSVLETVACTERELREVIEGLKRAVRDIPAVPEGRLVMIGQSHIDVAWLWPLKETMRKAVRTFSTMARLLGEYPEFRYTQSQPQLYAYVKEQAPELYEEIKAYVRSGRWEIVGGMWVEPDLNLPSGESLVRQLLFGLGFWQREFGLRPRVEWLPDTFGYCASLPQLLRQAGLDYFMTVKMYWNDTNRFPYDLFWWEGIDGSRVLTFINHGLNESATPSDTLVHWQHYKQQDVHPEAMYLYGHGDGGGGVTREMLELIARQKDGLPGVPVVRPGTAHEFFERAAAAGDKLPTWRGELYLETHRGTYTSVAKNKRWNRKAELLYRDAELWSAVAARICGLPYPADKLRQGWEKILLNQFHDILPGSSIPQVYQNSAEDYALINRIGEEVRSAAVRRLVQAVDTRGPGEPVVVFNSLPWERTDVVRLPGGAGLTVVDEAGVPVPQQYVTGEGGTELWFLATVPPMGYRTYWLQPADETGSRLTDGGGAADEAVSRATDRGGAEDAGGPVSRAADEGAAAARGEAVSRVTDGGAAAASGESARRMTDESAAAASGESARRMTDEGASAAAGGAGEVLEGGEAAVAAPGERDAGVRAVEHGAGAEVAPGRWETERLDVVFDERGRIVRLYDKVHRREVIPQGSAANQFQLFHDRPPKYDAWEIDPRFFDGPFEEAALEGAEVRAVGPVCDVLRFRWSIGVSRIEQDIILYRHTPRIDFATRVDWREEHKLLKVAFPVEVRAPYATYEIPFGAL